MLDKPQQVQVMVQPVDGPLCPSLDCLTYTNTYGASVGCGRTALSAELAAAVVAMLVLVLLLRT